VAEYPNWFEVTAKQNFEKHLLPLAGIYNLKFLQLGAFTGDASLWLLENILTGDDSLLIDVDTWKGSQEKLHETMDFDEVYDVYLNKIQEYENRVLVRKETTFEFLTHSYCCECVSYIYDFIYIDADHTTVGALLDAEMSWSLLTTDGIMAFDDYTWGHESGDPRLAPQVGIDLFLHRHQGEYELLAKNTQVWIRKR